MEVFRLMGMPDKVIGFDSLPADILRGFELCRAEGFPRHWKDFLGKKTITIPIPPERDQLTGTVKRFDPIIDEDSFFYLVDWTSNPSTEAWKSLCAYVHQNVDKDFRVKEKIEDMAIPLASNQTEGVTLEPEDMVVIPLPKEEKKIIAEKPVKNDAPAKTTEASKNVLKCPDAGCNYEAEGSYAKTSLRFHIQKKHKNVTAAA